MSPVVTGEHFGASIFLHYITLWQSTLHSESWTRVGLLHIFVSFHDWKAEEASQSFLPIDRWWESANLSAYDETEKVPRHREAHTPVQRKTPARNTTGR